MAGWAEDQAGGPEGRCGRAETAAIEGLVDPAGLALSTLDLLTTGLPVTVDVAGEGDVRGPGRGQGALAATRVVVKAAG